MRTALRIVLPLAVIAAAVAIAAVMIAARPAVETRPPEAVAPLVRVITVEPTAVDVVVRSQGTVVPRSETALLPEITGRVVQVSPSLLPGGFFETGELLVRLESRDYELAVVSARAQVAQATARLHVEEEEAAVARREWSVLGRGEAAPLVLREPQLADARAALDAARSALERAERDLARTTIRAPFAGRVRDKRVDIGQIVSPGTPLATIYGIDVAEIRLPLADEELAFLDLPLGFRSTQAGPAVTVHATFAGQQLQWQGRIIRTEGEIDPASRMVHLVAEVKDPYGRAAKSGAAPLAVGMFVSVDIAGRRLSDVFVVPRSALRGTDQVLVIDDSNRAHVRRVQVVRGEHDRVVVSGGLAPGERVSVSPLDVIVDGMAVRTATDAKAGS
jgi:membrane fusion protein, multidrug efflux system